MHKCKDARSSRWGTATHLAFMGDTIKPGMSIVRGRGLTQFVEMMFMS